MSHGSGRLLTQSTRHRSVLYVQERFSPLGLGLTALTAARHLGVTPESTRPQNRAAGIFRYLIIDTY